MYRLEIFDSALQNRDAVLINESQTIALDYLTMDGFSLSVPKEVAAQKGWYGHIADGDKTVCDCLISDVQPSGSVTTLTIRPLQALFDVETWRTDIPDVGAWIAQTITALFISNSDAAQNLPVTVQNSAVSASYEVEDKDTINLLDVICGAMVSHNIVTDAAINFAAGKIAVIIKSVTQVRVVEADLQNVLASDITLGDSYGSTNKLIIQRYTEDSETKEETIVENKSYYLHNDGTVDADDTDRIVPVFWALKRLQDKQDPEKPWEDEALSLAVSTLTPQKYDNEILLTYKTDDMVVRPVELEIGMVANIILRGNVYLSILTGKNITNDVTQLVFGNVRVALTKKLILKGL